MPTIDTLIQRTVPVTPDTCAAEVFARFEREPDTLAIPVVQDDRPVGLVERDGFLVRMASPLGRAVYSYRPISRMMDPEPVVVDAATRISTFCDSMLSERASTLMRSFVVTQHGRYLGVGAVLSLLQATSAASRARADELAETVRNLGEARVIAQAAAQAKSHFLGAMNHEIRTPMNGVLAVAELLRRQPLGPDAQAYVQTIVDSSEALLNVLSDAIDLARAEAGELELSPQPVFVRELMDEVQNIWSARAAQDSVTLMASYDGDPDLAAELDAGRLKQVFNNLVGEALKLARNGVVEASLRAWLEKDEVRLEARVRDNGAGMPKERLAVLFAPDAAIAPGASGIGLAICREIVTAMGGRIWAESNVGQGSTFAFDLRAKRAHLDRPGESNVSELADLQLQAQPHVLIVDDNATNRVVAQALCEMFGCTSECAEDGLEALEAVQTRRFDLVLMDIKMPRMDGIQATRAIRALAGPERDTPIVALTANADPDDARHYVEIGMAAVVEKPIKPERLRAAMNVALSGETAQQEAAPAANGRTAAA